MQQFLMRHAKKKNPGKRLDTERTLTSIEENKAKQAALFL